MGAPAVTIDLPSIVHAATRNLLPGGCLECVRLVAAFRAPARRRVGRPQRARDASPVQAMEGAGGWSSHGVAGPAVESGDESPHSMGMDVIVSGRFAAASRFSSPRKMCLRSRR